MFPRMDSLHNEIISLLELVAFWALSSHSEELLPLLFLLLRTRFLFRFFFKDLPSTEAPLSGRNEFLDLHMEVNAEAADLERPCNALTAFGLPPWFSDCSAAPTFLLKNYFAHLCYLHH